MSNLQEPTSPYKDKDASPSDYGLNMPDLPPPSSGPPGSGYPASMELYEMEGYVLQSLELLASTPTTQYYRPEIPHHEALPQCKRSDFPLLLERPLWRLCAVFHPRRFMHYTNCITYAQ